MALREINSKAPTPTIDVMVASGSSSVRPWRACAMHSQPAFVVMAYWYGLVALSTAGPTVGTLSLPPTSEQHPQRRCPALHRLVLSTLSIFPIEPNPRRHQGPEREQAALPEEKSAMIWRRPREGANAPWSFQKGRRRHPFLMNASFG